MRGEPGGPAGGSGDAVLLDELSSLGRAGQITAISRLSGGTQADAWLISYADGTRVVGKTITGAAPGVFAAEAGGLAALRGTGHLATPQVLAVTSGLLLLEALEPRDDSERSWEQFALDLAAAHRGTTGNRFGWHHDGYLGRVRQVNTWTASGHEFFAEHRLLRYLREPAAGQALTTADRRPADLVFLAALHDRERIYPRFGDKFFRDHGKPGPRRRFRDLAKSRGAVGGTSHRGCRGFAIMCH